MGELLAEVLAVFAVQSNLNNDGDVVVIDESKKQLIQDTFWAMHEISAEVEEVTTTPEPTEDEPDPEPVTEYILHITVSSKSVDALADLYRFTQDQRDILHQLLSEEMRPSLLALCGGTTVADGELCWPLPGHTYISCHFGEVDAFGNAGHRGTDIPAPEGTPILLPTAARCLSAAGTTATATKCCSTAAQGFPPAMPT